VSKIPNKNEIFSFLLVFSNMNILDKVKDTTLFLNHQTKFIGGPKITPKIFKNAKSCIFLHFYLVVCIKIHNFAS